MNVRELISDSYYLSGIVARSLETVTGQQETDGLTLLNDIIAEKSSDGRFIPYYGRESFAGVVGQEDYFIEDLVQIETLTVTLDEVRFPMIWDNRRHYWGSGRVNNINSLPYFYYSERQLEPITFIPGTRIWVYFKPSQSNYIFEVVGRFGLSEVTINDDISRELERFYLSYLKYKLAHRLCQFYDHEFSDDKMATLWKLEKQVDDVNPIDGTIHKLTQFPDATAFNWADANIGRGWRP